MSCSICQIRKEKRFCPAVHGRICAQCCGEQREVTLDCPGDCVYLRQAREHEKPRPLEELDPGALFPDVPVPQQFLYEHEHLITGLSYALARATRSDISIRDSEIIGGLSALARSWETLVNSGLHYDIPIAGAAQQHIAAQVRQTILEYRETEQKHLGYSRLRDADVLRALVFLVRLGQGRTSGRPRSKAFAEFLTRQFPEQPSRAVAEGSSGRIVLP